MQKFKRKSLYLALVAAVSSVGITSTASAAVHINSNGLGQALIYPYYSTRAGMDTYLSVVNTTASSKAVKVRFTEGKNSREVLDFNLYLSPHDMWTAAIVNTANGAKLITADKSCTAPAIPAGGKEFVNFAYAGTALEGINQSGGDGETSSLDRTREGYFEIIEMGVVTNTGVNAAITHVNNVPANCAVVQAASMNMSQATPSVFGNQSAALNPSQGGLGGTASLIGVAGGTDFGYDPVAIDGFTKKTLPGQNDWFIPGSILPDLTSANLTSIVFTGTSTVTSSWGFGSDSIGAILMHDNLINEFVLDNATLSGTDWVVTMPTKRYNVPVHNPLVADATQLFSPFTKKFWLNGACEKVNISVWNREEGNVTIQDFSPQPPSGDTSLCWETTVVTFKNSHVLGSANEVNVPVDFENGWLRMAFNATGVPVGFGGQTDANGVNRPSASQLLTSIDGNTYIGLPTVGFMVQDFINQNAAPGILATYGGNFNHKYTINVTPDQTF